MTKPDQKQRRGPKRKDAEELHGHCVSVRLNVAEIKWLDNVRASVNMTRAAYLRSAAIGKLPTTIPAINIEAWSALARSAANVNQIARHLNSGTASPEILEMTRVMSTIDTLRRNLISAMETPEDESQD